MSSNSDPSEEGSRANKNIKRKRKYGKHKDEMNEFLQKIHLTICDDILPQCGVSTNIEGDQDSLVILLGVSGGCDSIALFYSILEILRSAPSTTVGDTRYELQIGKMIIPCQIHVVHFDHCQRGDASDGDRLLVQDLCKKNNVDFHCFSWEQDTEGRVQKKQASGSTTTPLRFSQEVARDWRRMRSVDLVKSIIESNAKGDHCGQGMKGLILTAHHKDDSEETMLLKLLRGVHITNISGMEPVQPTNENHNIYFTKPLLRVRKTEIVDYLVKHNHTWREDESNKSGKYLRNRVRNELIPLLEDLVGGNEALESRFHNIEEQSKQLKADLTNRADLYLSSFLNESDKGYFVLPPQGMDFNVAEEEALYKWVCKESNNLVHLPYDRLRAISKQISLNPRKQQWKINIGEGWDVERNGSVLFLSMNGSPIRADSQVGEGNSEKLDWCLKVVNATDIDHEYENDTSFIIKAAISPSEVNKNEKPFFTLKLVHNNDQLKFLPPWRKGKNEIKISEFLRGQKIPLHRRGAAPIICMETIAGEQIIVAVFVENLTGDQDTLPGHWITNAPFHTNECSLSKDVEYFVVTRLI